MTRRRRSSVPRPGVVVSLLALAVTPFTFVTDATPVKRLHDLDDDFTADFLSRCEACVAVTHAQVTYIDRIKIGKLARFGNTVVQGGDFNAKEACAERFDGGARYGYAVIAGEKRVQGPGFQVFGLNDVTVENRAHVTAQLLARCGALMYAWDDHNIEETYNDVVEEVMRSSTSTAETRANDIFMGMLQKNCVENVRNQCESIEWFKSELSKRQKKAANVIDEAQRELYVTVTDAAEGKTMDGKSPQGSVDMVLAAQKCAGDGSDGLSRLACSVLAHELVKQGEDASRWYTNFTRDAKNYEERMLKGDEIQFDDDDADMDGNVRELYVDAMQNISSLRASTALHRAASFFLGGLSVDPTNYLARHNIAYMYKQANDFTKAKEYVLPLLAEDRANEMDAEARGESWKLLCEIEYHLSDTQSALESCRKSIELNPYNFHTQRLAGQIQVIEFFAQVRDIRELNETDDGFIYRQHALVDGIRAAKGLFTSAAILNPVKNEIAHLGMVLYFEQAALDAALKELTEEQLEVLQNVRHHCMKKGTEVDAACSDMLELAANHFVEVGLIPMANDAMQMALVLDDRRIHLWRELAYGFAHIGKFKLAKVALDHVNENADEDIIIPEDIQSLIIRGYEFEIKLESEKITASWSETRRPNAEERLALEREVASKLSAVHPAFTAASDSSTRDEL
jgi:tetratricopeptide (TPR) repeat protein